MGAGALHPRAPRTTSRATRRRGCAWVTRSSPAAATRTSRPGRTSSSSTRSPPRCAPRCATLLRGLAELCDGVRCDMAMLMTNEVFARTWHREPPATEFWPDGDQRRPDFIAEAYWDMESALHQQGFDYAYDKRLYDRLLHEDAAAVRAHLAADALQYLLRFIENHDEPRAAAAFGRARARRGGDPRHRAGRQALPRRAARGRPRAHPGLPRARPARDARPRPVGVLRPAAADRRRRRTGGCSRPTTRSCWPGRSRPHRRRSTSARRRPGAASRCASTARSPTC